MLTLLCKVIEDLSGDFTDFKPIHFVLQLNEKRL